MLFQHVAIAGLAHIDAPRRLTSDEINARLKPTLDRLRERFKPDMTEHEAAAHAQWLVKDAYGNMRGTIYDLIQEKQNHIPYRR